MVKNGFASRGLWGLTVKNTLSGVVKNSLREW